MKTVFVDTSFYVAMLSPRDGLHHEALEFLSAYDGDTITSEQVLTETGNRLAAGGERNAFLVLVQLLLADERATIVWSSRGLCESGIRLYAARPDKEWSLTDCISFVVMKQHRLTEALTADHHFEQAGFKALLG